MTLTSDSPPSSPEIPHGDDSDRPHPRENKTPVAYWSTDAIRASLESGHLSDWQAIVHALKRDPYGRTARQVEEVLRSGEMYGISTALAEVLSRARLQLEVTERTEVAAEVGKLLESSGLRQGEFASRIGVPNDKLNDFLTAADSPTATLMFRMRRIAERFGRSRS